jgi:hypothetical protein
MKQTKFKDLIRVQTWENGKPTSLDPMRDFWDFLALEDGIDRLSRNVDK